MLERTNVSYPRGDDRVQAGRTYHAQVVIVHEVSITIRTIPIEMIQFPHMLVLSGVCVELHWTCFAFVCRPVIEDLHVGVGKSLSAKLHFAGLAFGPMVIGVHVVTTFIAVVELLATS
jgi:hypothetical protein